MQLALLISSGNIPAELHAVVSPFTRPSFHFSLSNFPKGRGAEGLGTRLSFGCVLVGFFFYFCLVATSVVLVNYNFN